MDSRIFQDMWNESLTREIADEQSYWNKRAEEFNENGKSKKYRDEELDSADYIMSRKLIDKESSILDIGCGTGRHSIKFAKSAKDVTGIDISPEMLKYAQTNAEEAGLKNVSFTSGAWQDLNIDAIGWNKKFDFVFASMTPAINGSDALMKMLRASKKYCFMSGFVYKNDKLEDDICKELHIENHHKHSGRSIYCAFNILWNMNMYPEIIYTDMNWQKEYTLDKALELYRMQLFTNSQADENMVQKIKAYLEAVSHDGKVLDTVEAKVAWMLWKTE